MEELDDAVYDLDGVPDEFATLRYFKFAAEYFLNLYKAGVKQLARDKALNILTSPGIMQIEVSSDRVSHISLLRFVLLVCSLPPRFCPHQWLPLLA